MDENGLINVLFKANRRQYIMQIWCLIYLLYGFNK